MKLLKNNFDDEVDFDDLEKAKYYYMPDLNEFPDEIEYAEEIKEAKSLEELAQVFNKYSDEFDNGSRCYVIEIQKDAFIVDRSQKRKLKDSDKWRLLC